MKARVSLASLFSLALLPAFAIGCASDAEPDVCEEAIALVDSCTGSRAAYPAEGCVGVFEEQASAIVAGGCEGLLDDKADAWCHPALHWLGQCDQEPLQEVAALSGLNEVCPNAREDVLCESMRVAEDLALDAIIGGDRSAANDAYSEVLVVARSAMESNPDDTRRDPAFRYLLRERALGLLVHNVLTDSGTRSVAGDYAEQAQLVVSEHFPAYPEGSFPFALLDLAPQTEGLCEAPQGLLIFPGVVRLTDRDEFTEQAVAIEEALPCFHALRVETGSFVAPSVNADQGELAAAAISEEYGEIPLHTLGYSQGAMNSLTTLVNKPAIKSRVRSVMVMNSAAHGSEVADMGRSILDPLAGGVASFCESLPEFATPLCEIAAQESPRPDDWVLELMALSMGVPLASLEAFIEAEDGVSNAPDLRSFFERHLPGIASLSTAEANAFWSQRASELPQHALYYSFRTAISDASANLPSSNRLFHALLERAGERRPYNDMQVRLDNQILGGPVADLEVMSPVAEGNHWQWELATGAVPESTMPADMTERIPHRELLVGYYQTLVELGFAR